MAHTPGPLNDKRKQPPERVLVAVKLLSEMRYSSARQALMEQFSIGHSTAERVIAMARLVLHEDLEVALPTIRAEIMARLGRIIDRAETAGDYSAAVRGVREMVSILGIRAPEEVKITLDPETVARAPSLSDEALQALAGMADTNVTEH